jgi:pyrroline-5-carboxylate reductase
LASGNNPEKIIVQPGIQEDYEAAMKTIGFIGGGNMAESLLGGLISSGQAPQSIQVADPEEGRRKALEEKYGISCHTDNASVVAKSEIVVIAVKPQVICEVANALRAAVQQKQPLVISIAAGIRSSDLEEWLGGNLPVVRVMPNTPALVGAGASGMFANHLATEQMRSDAEAIMRSVGLTVWLENESQIDIVTALSGSGPAYIFRVIEAMEDAATRAGLDREISRLLAIETALGASRLAVESSDSPAVLRQKVTSPGGTTEQALIQLEEGGIGELFVKAIDAAVKRASDMADGFATPGEK